MIIRLSVLPHSDDDLGACPLSSSHPAFAFRELRVDLRADGTADGMQFDPCKMYIQLLVVSSIYNTKPLSLVCLNDLLPRFE